MAAKVNEELAEAVKTSRRGKPLKFAFVPKAQGGKLLLAKKILPKDIADAKKEIGGAAAIQGRCVGEEGILYFEVSNEVPLALPLQIKRVIKQDAGLIVDCLVRVKSDAEVEGDDDAVEAPADAAKAPPAPPPPAPERLAVVQRLNKLSPDIKTLLAQKGPHASRIQSLFVAVSGLIKNQDFQQAGKVLDELEPLIAQARAPEAAPAGPSPLGDGGARFMERLKVLMPQIQRAQSGDSPSALQVRQRTAAANSFARAKDFEKANAVLDLLEKLVKPAPAGPASGQAAPAAKPAPPVDGKGREKLTAALDAWQAASETVDGQIAKLQSALKSTGDEDLVQIAEFGLNAVTGNHKVKLMAAVLELRAARDESLAQLAKKAVASVVGLRGHLESDPQVAACDENEWSPVTIRQTLGPVLSQLESAMQAVV